MAWLGGVPAATWNPAETYYVIVGAGFSAAVNATTLLATLPQRLDNLPILVIGEEDPWSRYRAMPMGQWPTVLAAPAFIDQHRAAPAYAFLPTQSFAAAIDRQWQDVWRRQAFSAIRGRVRGIVGARHGFDIDIGEADPVKAARVDVCGGPGPARRLCAHQVDGSLWPYPALAAGGAGWNAVETGESFLERGTVVAAGQPLIVFGGGPTAAWCVERALQEGCEVLWVGDQPLNSAFVSSQRNDHLAQGPLRRHRRYHTSVVAQYVYPASSRVRFAEGYAIESLAPADGGAQVGVTFRPAPSAARRRFVNARRADLGGLAFETCAQAVIAIGQEIGHQKPCRAPACALPTDVNSWATRLRPLLEPAYLRARHFILDPAGLPLGLQTVDGDLRVLGAAFLAHPYTQRPFQRVDSVLFRYLASLCEQAQVDRGAAMSAFTTARANAWFWRRGNRNRNSATLDDLYGLAGLRPDHARRWYAIRSYRIDPLTTGELRNLRRETRER